MPSRRDSGDGGDGDLEERPEISWYPGQLIDINTVNTPPFPGWTRGIVLAVKKHGRVIQVFAGESDPHGAPITYNLDLDKDNDFNCMAPLGA